MLLRFERRLLRRWSCTWEDRIVNTFWSWLIFSSIKNNETDLVRTVQLAGFEFVGGTTLQHPNVVKEKLLTCARTCCFIRTMWVQLGENGGWQPDLIFFIDS